MEAAVIGHLDEMLLRAGHLDKVEANIKQILGGQATDTLLERERTQKELAILEKDIESAFRLHADMDKNPEVLSLVREKLEKLAEKKQALAAYLESLESNVRRNQDAKEARSVIEDRALAFKKGWNKAAPVTQKRLVRRLIERLIYTHDGLHTYYVTAKDSEMDLPVSKDKKASESSSGASFGNVHFLNSSQRHPGDSFLSPGASVVRAGGPNETIPEHLYLYDSLEYQHSPRRLPLKTFREMSRRHLTASQIAEKTGLSKQAVLERLRKCGIRRTPGQGRHPDNYRYSQPPYGMKARGGRLLPDVREMKVVRMVIELRDRERWTWSAIVARLNESGQRTRKGRLWSSVGTRRIHKRWAGKT